MAHGRVEATEDKGKANTEEAKGFFTLFEFKGKEQQIPDAKEPRYRNIVHLWEFLLELLAEDSCRSLICWSNKERREFKLKNPSEVAKRWGLVKRKKGMNYEKLSRALRYYYQQGIIKKVPGQRLVYKFNKLPYKYEPGVTSHASKISASIHNEQERTPVTPPSPQKTADFMQVPSAFIPTSTPLRKSWSWPVMHLPRCLMCLCPSSTSFMCSTGNASTGSRNVFPPVDPLTSLSFPFGFKPVEPVSPVFDAFPAAWKMLY